MKYFLYLLIAVAIAFGAKQLLGGDAPLFGGAQLANPFPPTSPLYADHQAFVDRVNGNPKIRALFADAGSQDAFFVAWNHALATGARTLPADRLAKVSRTQVAIMARLPQASCAKLIRPRETYDAALGNDMRAAVEGMSPHHHKVMTEFAYDALAAKADGRAEVVVDEQQLRYAYQSLAARYPGAFGQRLVGAIGNPSAASDEDACWAANTLLHAASDLNPQASEAVLRTLYGAKH